MSALDAVADEKLAGIDSTKIRKYWRSKIESKKSVRNIFKESGNAVP